jgi:hypothetical protein
MLKPSCRRFRMEFTPGMEHPHRKACPACAAYAAAMERAAKKAPLPSRLRSKLRAVPAAASDDEPRMPMPPAPMPAALRGRLQQMSRRPQASAPRPLPAWVRSPRYAVAASFLLAMLLGAAFGNPAEATGALTRSMDRAVRPRVERAIEGVEGRGYRRLDDLKSAVREGYGAARTSLKQTVEQSLETLGNQVTELDKMRKSMLSLDFLNAWKEIDL